jgi:IS605 OrfB family transposase
MHVQLSSRYSNPAPAGEGQARRVAFRVGARGQHGLNFAGRWLSLWDSFGLGRFDLRAGNFSEDSRGRWYLNVCVPNFPGAAGERYRPFAESILDRSVPSLGVDLGLKRFAAFSDVAMAPIDAECFYRDLEPALARSQRARKPKRTRTIHAKVANRRKDFLHKLSTRLVKANGAIFVGDVNASALAKTRQAKSVLDAGWSAFRTMLLYKCDDAGVWFDEVDEAFSTQTCSVCNSRAGPKGREGLGMRGWQCSVCGAIHDRDVNAAHNILAAGHRRLAEGILAP